MVDAGSHSELPFPLKLHYIIEQEPTVLKWNSDKKSFRIIDEDALVGRILLKHFRTARFSSFTRNLNIYGFKKIAKGEFAGSYFHHDFSEGGIDVIALMKRCPRKPAAGSDKGEKARITKKPSGATHTQGNLQCKPTAHPVIQSVLAIKCRPSLCMQEPAFPPPPPPHQQQQMFVSPFLVDRDKAAMEGEDMCIDSSFLDTSFGSEGEYNNMDHELALPPHGIDDGCYADHHHCHQQHHSNQFNQPALCSTPCQSLDHFQNPFTMDDDLVEWKKVLSRCDGYDNDGEHEHCDHRADRPNAYCVNVPSGPLGVMIEKRGDKVCLSKFTNDKSPLAHIPIGSQLVNLDGRDTTKMVVCQITKLDKSVRHRSRMIIFMECWDEGSQQESQQQQVHDNRSPAVSQSSWPRQHQQQTQKEKEKFTDDIDMDSEPSNTSNNPAALGVFPQSNSVSTWLSVSGMQSFYEAM